MLRRHFMTKVGYKPNVIIIYYSSEKLSFYYNKTSHLKNNFDTDIYLINEEFNDGIGKIYLYIKKIDKNVIFNNKIYSEDGKEIDNIFNPETIISCFIITGIDALGFVPNYVEKLIIEDVKFMYQDMIKDTLLKRFIIPPNINYYGDIHSISLPNTIEDVIFTSYTVPKYLNWKNKNIIKCPPNLVDKYREYYPNATAANNILYIKKVTKDNDKDIDFGDYKDITNELYITKNYTNDGYTEITIVNHDDFKNNKSSYYINSNDIVDIIFPESIVELSINFIGKNLTKLTIPKNVTSIASYFFQQLLILEENLINLSSIDITTMNSYKRNIIKNGIEENGCVIGDCNYSSSTYKNTIHGVRYALYKNIIIPDYVETIRDSAFYGATIEYIFISKNITNISPNVSSNIFSYTNCIIEVSEENEKYDSRDNCNAIIETATNTLIAGNSLTNIPDSVEIINSNALYRVSSLKTVNLKNVKTIKRWAFKETYIDTLILNKTITSIEEAFDKPDNVIYNGTMEEWGNVYTYHSFRNGTIIHCLDGDITYNY